MGLQCFYAWLLLNSEEWLLLHAKKQNNTRMASIFSECQCNKMILTSCKSPLICGIFYELLRIKVIYIYAHTNDISWLRNIHKKLSLYLKSTLTIRKLGSMSSKLNSITFFLKEFVSLTKENYKSQPELYIHIRFWQLNSTLHKFESHLSKRKE